MGTYQRRSKPTAFQKAMLSNATMSARQAARIRSGETLESQPSDYGHHGSDEDRRLRDARRAVEDRRIMRELGLENDA